MVISRLSRLPSSGPTIDNGFCLCGLTRLSISFEQNDSEVIATNDHHYLYVSRRQ